MSDPTPPPAENAEPRSAELPNDQQKPVEQVSDDQNPVEEFLDDALDDDNAAAGRGRYGLLSIIVAGLFGLFYVYDLWEAIGNIFLLTAFYAQLELTVPWAILIANLLVPPAVFVLAFALGRRRRLGSRALLFLVGLAVVAVLTLDLQSLV